MLLNYLTKNFYEEAVFLKAAQIGIEELQWLTQNRQMPKPSYVLENEADSVSFICNFEEKETYRFHLKNHIQWINSLKSLHLDTENRAKSYFQSRYNNAVELFFSGTLGTGLIQIEPRMTEAFDETKFNATWQYFLDGVYGVCTRSGMPENIFLKQVYAMFIDFFTEKFTAHDMPTEHRETLMIVVNLLDEVESDFASHEVHETSRQRCILDVRKKYFTQ